MLSLFRGRTLYITVAAFLVVTGAVTYYFKTHNQAPVGITGTVDEGQVRQVVSVSGSITAKNTAELGFPGGGTIATVHVRKGDVVTKGALLISLDAASLRAEVADAEAALAAAKADYAAVVAGASGEARTVSEATVALRTEALARTKNDEALKVANALRTLRSSNLAAFSNDPDEDAPAPIITGTYQCDSEGTYTLKLYRSNTESGYSVNLSGIETGTFPASTDQAIALGGCGLRAQFSPGTQYGDSVWYIDIPNKKSAAYTANKNAYSLALANEKSAVAAAERELSVAEANQNDVAAPARSEALARGRALIAQAEARVDRARATENDSILRSPFDGTVVDVSAVAGEAVTTAPVITIVSPGGFELTARLAEIDVGQVAVGQTAEVVFDTAVDTTLKAVVDYIAPTATIINGVAYFEARLALTETPAWIRGGLNADINIITKEATGVRVPKRFITERDGIYSVQKLVSEATYATTTIGVTLMGNDGFATITGLSSGDTVLAP